MCGFDAIFILRCILVYSIIVGFPLARGAKVIRPETLKTDTCECCFSQEYAAWGLFIDFFTLFLEP